MISRSVPVQPKIVVLESVILETQWISSTDDPEVINESDVFHLSDSHHYRLSCS